MRIITLSSGSAGNCTYLESDKSKILIDVGLTGKMAVNLMTMANIKANEIDAIFVTHEHIDHIKGVGVLSRKYDIPIYANAKTWLAMQAKIGKIASKNINVFKSNTFFSFRDLDIRNVSTFHDAADPVFFVFYQKQQKISILTDTGIVSRPIIDAVRDSNVLILESNHDEKRLMEGPYPQSLKYRIRGEYGHLSNDTALDIVDELVKAQGEKIILGHLSSTNNSKEIVYSGMENLLVNKGIKIGDDLDLEVSEEFKLGKLIDLGGDYSWI